MPAAGQDLSGAGQMREVLPLVPQATSKQKDGPECHQAPSVEIKACAPGAHNLTLVPIAGVHRKETDPKNGSQIGQLN